MAHYNLRIFPALMVLILFPLFAFSQTPEDEEDVYFILMGEADKAIADEDYEAAAARLNEALELDPDNPSNVLLLTNLGTVYNYMDEDSLALSSFDKALRMAPAMTTALENRGRLFLKLGRDFDAYKDFGRIIELDSCNVNARYYHGLMALYGGDYRQAESDFNVLESVAPDNIITKIAMSSMYSATNRHGLAKSYYLDILKDSPSPENFVALAECCIADDNLSEAAVVISEAIEKYPGDSDLYFCRAWVNKERYLIKEAREDVKKAVSLGGDPGKGEAILNRGHSK